MAKEEQAKEGEEAAPKKSKKKLFIFAGVGVVVLILALAVPMLMGGEKKEVIEEPLPEYKLAKFDTFIVNLSEQKSFLKVTLLLEYDLTALNRVAAPKSGQGGGHGGGGGGGKTVDPTAMPPQLVEKEPILKDAVIRVLSSKRPAEVLTAEGKDQIKEELIEALNEALGYEEPVITNIFFSEYIVQ
jgi:flagellar basal body-associated protein FliL